MTTYLFFFWDGIGGAVAISVLPTTLSALLSRSNQREEVVLPSTPNTVLTTRLSQRRTIVLPSER